MGSDQVMGTIKNQFEDSVRSVHTFPPAPRTTAVFLFPNLGYSCWFLFLDSF